MASAPKWIDLGLSYEDAVHGMQTAVKFEQESLNSDDGSPKHLRVGVNNAMSDHAALAYLLIEKGLISDAEYREAVRLAANDELNRYEKHIASKVGHDRLKFR